MIELFRVLDAMRMRFPWPVARSVLAAHKVPVGQGWEKTKQKCQGLQMTAAQLSDLKAAYKEHLLCGEKTVRYYPLSVTAKRKIKSHYLNARIPESVFANEYPLAITSAKLKKEKISKPVLVAVEEKKNGIAVVFSSIKVIEERTELPVGSVKVTAPDGGSFSKIIGVVIKRFQAFDILWIPNGEDAISVRTDIVGNLGGHVQSAQQEMIRTVIQGDTSVNLIQKSNLFPVINAIYQVPGEGTVVELAFITGGDSLKHERQRTKTTCLRTEAYHKGGKAAVNGAISPFRIGVRWAAKRGNVAVPELGILGSHALTMWSTPNLESRF